MQGNVGQRVIQQIREELDQSVDETTDGLQGVQDALEFLLSSSQGNDTDGLPGQAPSLSVSLDIEQRLRHKQQICQRLISLVQNHLGSLADLVALVKDDE